MRNMSPSLAAVLLGLLSVHATEEHARNVAQLEPKDAESYFKSIDVDADGILSRAEALAYIDELGRLVGTPDADASRKQTFTTMDADGDGALSVRELQGFLELLEQMRKPAEGRSVETDELIKQAKEARLFNKLDANGDGQLTRTEAESWLSAVSSDPMVQEATFAAIDSDGDGLVQTFELHAYMRGDGEPPAPRRVRSEKQPELKKEKKEKAKAAAAASGGAEDGAAGGGGERKGRAKLHPGGASGLPEECRGTDKAKCKDAVLELYGEELWEKFEEALGKMDDVEQQAPEDGTKDEL